MTRHVPAPHVLALLATLPVSAFAAEAQTRVYLNGQAAPVHFNDGDSFRVLGGPFEGTKTRLAGYNTLESFGGVHQWGDWSPHELYAIAKMATYNARKGTWHCESDLSRDGYGRMLWYCEDLAIDQIRKGFAHAYQVEDKPSKFELLAAQREAIEHKRGIWAHGVPAYVLTSIHSLSEDPTREKHYNRLISPVDGRTHEWAHTDNYEQCQVVCNTVETPKAEVLDAMAKELLGNPAFAKGLGEWSPTTFALAIGEYWRHKEITPAVRDDVRPAINKQLDEWRAAGRFGEILKVKDACMTYVDFKERFGNTRATCLDHH